MLRSRTKRVGLSAFGHRSAEVGRAAWRMAHLNLAVIDAARNT